MPSENDWLGKLRKLNPNIDRHLGLGPERFAPHKPLLLLCLLDIAETGELKSPQLLKLPSLRLRFESYWPIVQPRWHTKPNFDLPFYHLSTQGFWKALSKTGAEATSPETTVAVVVNNYFYSLLQNGDFRNLARTLLVETWFPEKERTGLYTALGLSKDQVKKLSRQLKRAAPLDFEKVGRDARFRVTVVTQYQFTCALTGYGLQTGSGRILVQAAHIHAFSKSQNDHPDNGLALSRDAHWMFDEGLWTVDENYRVLVSQQVFKEWGPEGSALKARIGAPLIFPSEVTHRPNPVHLTWHRKSVFKSA